MVVFNPMTAHSLYDDYARTVVSHPDAPRFTGINWAMNRGFVRNPK
jgi:hypothetical protein